MASGQNGYVKESPCSRKLLVRVRVARSGGMAPCNTPVHCKEDRFRPYAYPDCASLGSPRTADPKPSANGTSGGSNVQCKLAHRCTCSRDTVFRENRA